MSGARDVGPVRMGRADAGLHLAPSPGPPQTARSIVVRRSAGAWVALGCFVPAALVGFAGALAMALQGEPVVLAPLGMFVLAGLPAAAILRRRTVLDGDLLVHRSLWRTRHIPLTGLASVVAPPSQATRGPRIGFVALWFAGRSEPVTIHTLWQREQDLALLRARLFALARAHALAAPELDWLRPVAWHGLLLCAVCVALLARAVSDLRAEDMWGVVPLAGSFGFASFLWSQWMRGFARIEGRGPSGRLWHRTLAGRWTSIPLATVERFDDTGNVCLGDHDVVVAHGLLPRGRVERFMATARGRAAAA